ncbi:MAG TPA: alcohol dehydrogenase catalytic domain-containing protein, partial [Acidimicrobiia bacterium]|nr:alcohol dehydrogenase catalytic domain-containing protein [Acidimicrobiia bacterium]
MKALVFGVEPHPPNDPLPSDANLHEQMLRATPMGVQELADPHPLAPDWLVLRTRLCGICGSDTKQVFMDTGGDWPDASMTAFISFPQVLGHEVVGTVAETGASVRGLEPGQRVLL